LAASDGLTGLANRRAFDETLARECKRLARSQASIGLLMLDLDAFKAYNDCYGHVAGDECLRSVARVLSSSMQRSADVAARYGGEEFVCIFPDTDLRGALAVAERVKAGIAGLAIPHTGQPSGSTLTASFGVIGETCTYETDPISLVRRVDACLYRAKDAGRNCIMTGGNASPSALSGA
jgi:diguanylate cyclase (GGDEF)-like protein